MGKFLLILGRGVGQVMFQNNALSGGLMLVGVLLNFWQMALLAVAGKDRKSTRLNSSHSDRSRMPSSA